MKNFGALSLGAVGSCPSRLPLDPPLHLPSAMRRLLQICDEYAQELFMIV